MNFLLTNYIYPLEEKIALSENLNFFLDNPRTDEEINAVHEYLHKAYHNSDEYYEFEEDEINEDLTDAVNNLLNENDCIKEFYTKISPNKKLDCYELLARIWIIARYDDGGYFPDFTKEMKPTIIRNSSQLVDYSYLISLLINNYSENGFILDHQYFWFDEKKYIHFECLPTPYANSECLFPSIESNLSKIVSLLDKVLNENPKETKEKLLYIAGLLKVAGHDINDNKTKLVILVSIIEILLTHKPNPMRYHVEDSITKQFQLKAATLIYLHYKSKDIKKDINDIKSRLKEIYNLRSDIAHGNFEEFQKDIDKKKKNNKEFSLDNIICELYDYLFAIISEYLSDVNFVDFLKES